ncbi:helix-turn-helix domain-containing protein [Bacteroides sp.]|uniref:helix-turn-helix domain-containing protein n=1 Tax=Bacteroides sp. TaxID=29523 RepID=UPI002FC93EB8
MGVFYMGEHTACSQYLANIELDFKYVEVEAGSIFSIKQKKEKHIFFFLEGSVRVRYNEFPNKVFGAGEMIFLPKLADCYGEALTRCKFIVHVYRVPIRLCAKVSLNSIVKHANHVQYDFKSLPICQLLKSYLQLLKSYLVSGLNCCNLHRIKREELFLVLRTHYKKEELAQFFYPMLGKSLNFRSKVMASYMESRTAKDLAGYCGYSETHFNDVFIAEFGDTPYTWMQKQKAKHIIGRLVQSEVSLKEIIDEFYFSSHSHLNRFCNKHYGATAAQVRMNLLSENQ